MLADLLVPLVLLDEEGVEGLALVLLILQEVGDELRLVPALGLQNSIQSAVALKITAKSHRFFNQSANRNGFSPCHCTVDNVLLSSLVFHPDLLAS